MAHEIPPGGDGTPGTGSPGSAPSAAPPAGAATPAATAPVTVRLFAAARAAAGAAELTLPAAPLDELLAGLRAAHPPRFADVLAVSSLVSDGIRLDPADSTPIRPGAVIDVLPPFAGG